LFRLHPVIAGGLFQPFRRQLVEPGLRQPFGSRRLFAEILDPAHCHTLVIGQFEAKPFVPLPARVWLMRRKFRARGHNPGENASHKQAGAWTTHDDSGKIAEVTKMK
jgi:hypothetical protein